MMQVTRVIFLAALVLLLILSPAIGQKRRHTSSRKYVPVTVYDPKRNAAQDIASAIKEAQRTHKNVLVEVGGEWCSWCHRLDKFFLDHPDLLQLRDKNFITLKINFSEENENKEVLSKYPPIGGYPHIFFLDSQGKLLLSQDTGVFEAGTTYNLDRLTTVLTNWAPKP
jgi:thioredoxin-related protein